MGGWISDSFNTHSFDILGYSNRSIKYSTAELCAGAVFRGTVRDTMIHKPQPSVLIYSPREQFTMLNRVRVYGTLCFLDIDRL